MASELDSGKLIAIAFIGGFAIQQFLQILDSFITLVALRLEKVISGISATDLKKSLMHLIAFLCGCLIAGALQETRLLHLVIPGLDKHWLDILISGFVLGSGTEAVNTLLKYLGYVKDAQKFSLKPELKVSVIPQTANVRAGETAIFESVVENDSNQKVSWRVLQSDSGGTIVDGLYTAPPAAGVYTVIATSEANKSVFATAKVTVTI